MKTLYAALCVLVLLILAPSVSLAKDGEWVEAETPNFILYCHCSESTALERGRRLELFHATLLRLVRTADPNARGTKLAVYFVRNNVALREVRPGMPLQIAGFYYASPELIGAFTPLRDSDGLAGEEVLFHEYAHHFMRQYMPGYFPAWYVEGFAEFVMTAKFKDERIEVGHYNSVRASWLLTGAWLDLKTLLTRQPQELRREENARFYSQSWLLAHYINMTPSANQAFGAYIRAVRNGVEPVKAFEEAFDQTLAEFTQTLRAYVRTRLNLLALPPGEPIPESAVKVRRLEASADTLLLLDARLRMLDAGSRDGGDMLAEVRKAANALPGDRRAALVLARAETYFASPQTARDVLAPLLNANPNDRDAQYLTGLAWLTQARTINPLDREMLSQARRAFIRANRIEPDHYATLYRYVQASEPNLFALSPDLLAALVRAADLAPQVGEIGINAGMALAAAGRIDEAIAMLRPIAFDPHGGAAARKARQTLVSLQSMGAGGAPALAGMLEIAPDGPEAAPPEAPPAPAPNP